MAKRLNRFIHRVIKLSHMRWQWMPAVLIGIGVLLGIAVLIELVAIYTAFGTFEAIYIIFTASTLPFYGIIIGGGFWLHRSGIPPSRYRRIAGWCVGTVVFFAGLFLIVGILTMPSEQIWGAVRWAVTIAMGVGILIGIFESRAIEHARKVEGRRIREEELERRNERLEEFASIVAHDLRNPLSVAIGRLELANDGSDQQLEVAEEALDRIDRILTDTLDLARHGRVITDPEPIDLRSVAEAAWRNVDTKDATLDVAESTTLHGDSERLGQVFENVFRNAIEHGSDDVTVRVGLLANSAGFYIADDGPGIPEAERESVFEPGTSETADGTGFGLTIVKRILSAHGWSIAVTASRDGGARFEILTEKAVTMETSNMSPVMQ